MERNGEADLLAQLSDGHRGAKSSGSTGQAQQVGNEARRQHIGQEGCSLQVVDSGGRGFEGRMS